jgi:monoamine oxidase
MPRTVIVIGAGLAGLAAAYELSQTGYEVVIIEAKGHVGGRVHTLHAPFANHLYAEAGAINIPEEHNHVMHYIKLFGLPLVPLNLHKQTNVYYVKGKRIVVEPNSKPIYPFNLPEEEKQWRSLLTKYTSPVLSEIAASATLERLPKSLEKYDKISFSEFLSRQGASPSAISLMRLGYLDFWGDGIDTVSALMLLRDLALKKKNQQRYAIHGGNDRLPKEFARRLRNIHYNTSVTEIKQHVSNVHVVIQHKGKQETLTADYIICSVPFSVLDQIKIFPPFSSSKQHITRELSYTSVTRIYLQFLNEFWVENTGAFAVITDLPIMRCLGTASHKLGLHRLVESYTAGSQARLFAAMSEDERLNLCLAEISRVFPGASKHYISGTSYCWDHDQWARGGYAWFRPGQMSNFLPELTSVEGRIHFAGEHTSPWSGWMQGAIESGCRAAQEVSRRLELN